MTTVAATKLRTTISDLLDRVVHHGERAIDGLATTARAPGREDLGFGWAVAHPHR